MGRRFFRVWWAAVVGSVGSEWVGLTTSVETGSQDLVPNAQTWSRARWTTLLTDGSFALHDPTGGLWRSALEAAEDDDTWRLLGASKWGLFFHGETDATRGRRTSAPYDESKCVAVYRDPVYLINMLTWQVGHLLIDVLEPLYYATRGSTRQLLVLSVAMPEEAAVLPAKIRATVEGDTPFSLLRLFTDRPVLTRDAIATPACFREVAVELDEAPTYHARGVFDADLDLEAADAAGLRSRYAEFRAFVRQGLGLDDDNAPRDNDDDPLGVYATIVERAGARALTNLDAVAAAVEARLVQKNAPFFSAVRRVKLEEMAFSDQLALFQRTRLLIAQYGTAAHNVLFLPAGAVVLLLVQPGWCESRWVYANQALLSNASVVVQCTSDVKNPTRLRWAHRAHRQGPWIRKDAAFAVDLDLFLSALDAALDLLERGGVESSPRRLVFREPDTLTHTTDCDCAGPPLPTPRVHATDVRVDASGVDGARVALVPEVLASSRFDLSAVRLCVAVGAGNADAATCFSSAVFNEFSTVDVRVDRGARVDLKLWLADAETDATIPQSETYLVVRADGAFPGLGVSTLSHGLDAPDAAWPTQLSEPPIVDARRFRPCEAAVVTAGPSDEDFCVRLDVDFDLQGRVAAACRRSAVSNGNDDDACFRLAEGAAATALRAARLVDAGLPAVHLAPRPGAPLVFLHNEKTAGSTLRRALVDAAVRLRVPFYVPCYDAEGVYREDRRCYSFDLVGPTAQADAPPPETLAVLGGHFHWDVLTQLPAARAPALVTVVRHPVDRAVSLYYERVYPRTEADGLGGHRLDDLTAGDVAWLLGAFKGSAFSMYRDEGFCDAHCKLLLGLNVYKGRTPDEVDRARAGADASKFAALDRPLDTQLALDRLARCVVGLQEDWPNTVRVLEHWFPWLRLRDDGARLNVGRPPADPRPEHRALIEQCNTCDLAVYRAARRQFAAQLTLLEPPPPS